MYLFLIYCFQIFTFIHTQDPVHVCDPFPVSSPSDPSFPTDFPDSFSFRVEINLNGEKSSDVYVNFDYNRRKAATVIQTENLESKLVFDYPTNEIHVIESYANYTKLPLQPGDQNRFGSPRFCKSIPLDSSDYLNYYFGVNKVNSTYFIPNEPLEILHLDFPQTYSQRTQIRGIPCDCYLSCVYRPETKQNFTMEFCFSVANFLLPGTSTKYNRLPVRATYNGLVQLFNGSYANFTEVHNYYEFRPNVVDEEFFQTPTDLVCMNRKPTKKIPSVGRYFRFSAEQSVNGFTNYLKDLVYDGDRQMVRIETRPMNKAPETFYVTDPLKIINDYNIGVSFNYNRKLKNCSITAIPTSSLDEDSGFTEQQFNSTSSYLIKLRSPESLLGLDGEYIYTGSRVINNIPGDNYVSDKFNLTGIDFTSEYVFTADGFGFSTSSGFTLNIPYTYVQRAPKKDYYSYTTYYNFDQDEFRYELFDVTDCFPKSDRIDIRFKFPYTGIISAENLNKDLQMIRLEMYYTLVTETNETWTRFSNPKVSVSGDGNLYVRTSILPNPPSLSLFTLVPGKWLITPAISTQYNVESASVCAGYCLANLKCLSFDYSTTSKNCFLNAKHGSEADLRPSTYLHYSRNTMDGFYSRPSYTLWNRLYNLTRSSQIGLSVATSIDFPVKLVATDLVQLADNENRFGSTFILSKYNRAQPNKKFKTDKDDKLENQNIDDCAKACSEELRYECQSFDYCYISGDCRLSSKYLSTISSEDNGFIDESECDIYEKDGLFHYTELPGKAAVNTKDTKVEANSPVECAAKCDNENRIHCRSFNFCPGDKTCYLSTTHLLDSLNSTDSTDLICTHYSRNYLSDFSFSSTAEIPLVGDIEFENSNAEECARYCVIADGFNCKSISFCPNSKKCLLISDKPNNVKPTNLTDTCVNYLREFYYVTSTKVNDSPKDNDSSTTVLAVLSSVFAVLGLTMGAIVSYIYIKKKPL